MDELKNKPSISGVFERGNFDFRPLERLAFMRFVECPKFLTLVRHTDLDEITPIHCYAWVTRRQTDFQVPKQDLLVRYTADGARFTLVRVINHLGVTCWLVVCEVSRRGFLVHGHVLNRFGNIVSPRRCKRKFIKVK